MKLLFFSLCLLATLFQVLFASTSLDDKRATLKNKMVGHLQKAKKTIGELAKRKKSPDARKKVPAKPVKKRSSEHGKSNVANEGKPKSLIELLPKALVEIVIGYFKDDTYYSIVVSTHSWRLKDVPGIAVDSARVYVMTDSEGLKGLNHSSANLKESERRCIKFGNPRWPDYDKFSSSHDGRYVSFGHFNGQTEVGTKWLMQGNKVEGGKFKPVAFGGGKSSWGWLSRDGQTLVSYSVRRTSVTRVYQIKGETGKGPTAILKFELNGTPQAVSGNGSRVMVSNARRLEIHSIGKDTSELVCRVGAKVRFDHCALNEDGSEAAYVQGDGLRIAMLDNVVGGKVKPVIFTVKVPESTAKISKLVYSDGNKLHVLRNDGKVSLFDPLTKTLIPIEALQEGQEIISAAISPNADCIAIIRVLKERGNATFETTVKRKPTTDDWMDFFGYEAGKATSGLKQAKSPSDEQQ